jgi:cytochrome oxidase Cu insertion factor (SCO1/SenC/PrrC family)
MKSSQVRGQRDYSGRVRPLAQVLMAVLCALAAAGCGGGGSGGQAASQDPAATRAEPPSATSGRERAPTIAGTSLDDQPISLADYRGRPVLVNIWSSW